jgi:hypothetical protein
MEDRIERLIESRMDSLDRRYMAGQMTPAEYEHETATIEQWAREMARLLDA